METKNKVVKWITTIVMLIIGILCIYPFIFMLSSSFKLSGDVLQHPFQIIPDPFTLDNVKGLFQSEFYSFPQWYWNTILMTVTTLDFKICRYYYDGIWILKNSF